MNANLGMYEWGGVSINLDDVPEKVISHFVKKQIVHKLSNEVAATVGKEREKGNGDFDEETFTLDQRNKMVAKILAGDIRLVIGERGDAVEAIAYELAKKQAEMTLKPKGLWPMPNKAKDIKADDATIDFNGRIMSREDLTDMVFEKYKVKFMDEAKVEHEKRKETARLAKSAKVPVKESITESIDDLI